MRRESRIYFYALSFCSFFAGHNLLQAQGGASGTIVGFVRDTTGAVIPKAAVSIRNLGTNLSQTDATGESGEYSFSYIPPGNYEIRATKTGFRASVVPNVKLDTGATFRVDISLQVGEVSESVEVQATAPIIQTEEASVGHLVEQKRIVELPLNGRKFEQLQMLSPGSVNAFNHQSTAGLDGGATALQSTSQPTAIATNGSRANQTLILVDGGSVVNNFGRTATVSPNPDEIAEFRVTSANFSAEYGYGSNVLSVSTRSGTNALHGTLWEFLRNKDLDARNFFARTAEPRKRNQFGVAAGGPVYIPGVYNGKDRTFWFFNFEGQRERLGRTIISSVPTARMRMGDLSELPARIYDPRTTRPDASSPSGFVRDPFPGNIIPANRVDQPIAQRFLEWIPLPNQPGFANNNLFTTSEINDYEHYGFRVDHRLTEKDNLSFRGSFQSNEFPNSTGPYGPSVKPPYDLGTNPKQSTGHSYVLSWVRNITPNTLSDIRA